MCSHLPSFSSSSPTSTINYHLVPSALATADLTTIESSSSKPLAYDPFMRLPVLMLLNIMDWLNNRDIVTCTHLNKYFYNAALLPKELASSFVLSKHSIIAKKLSVTVETLKQYLQGCHGIAAEDSNLCPYLIDNQINWRLKILDLTPHRDIYSAVSCMKIPNLEKIAFRWKKTAYEDFSRLSFLREMEVFNHNKFDSVVTEDGARWIKLNKITDEFIRFVNSRNIAVRWAELNDSSYRGQSFRDSLDKLPEDNPIPCSEAFRRIGEIVHLNHLTLSMPKRLENSILSDLYLDKPIELAIHMPSSEHFRAMERLTKLRSLTLKHVSFSENEFNLLSLVNLTALSFIECRYIDNVTPHLPFLERLEELEMNCGEGSDFMRERSIYSLSKESVKRLGHIKPLKKFKLVIPRSHLHSFEELIQSCNVIKITELILRFQPQKLMNFTPGYVDILLKHPTVKKITCVERGAFPYSTSSYSHLGGVINLVAQLKEEGKKVDFGMSIISEKPPEMSIKRSRTSEKNCEMRLEFGLNF